ncbi:class I fructose-bisphosphate aldolase [Mucilaginibacter aquariorum]|uniref:fructose-bisphosphate aldolase n=1 Tax=Mucilaginibacter aquariorum TaxID=2967225 RepID=A0ABT1SY76_9SPHI|nr:class I fructose-bisphosphate aldolase [Mucilaginibacter aquariorum]MCQ6957021.1 fructose-bisphosphate aldolase class I [Mucilaginibacter aquariorum]
MDTKVLQNTITHLLSGTKGILAMDESTASCNKRFEAVGIEPSLEMRRSYRELIVTAPQLENYISGAILYDETFNQQTKEGIPFIEILKSKGILPGIKVDLGTVKLAGFPGEMVTEGIDGLREKLAIYFQSGARFAKWRGVITINGNLPSSASIYANCHLLARYASLCQEAGLVPIVEPEVLMTGDHNILISEKATRRTLNILFEELYKLRVNLNTIILKPNMVIPGLSSPDQVNDVIIADSTILCLLESVPSSVPGIAFLSGGQSPLQATSRLHMMHKRFKHSMPWKLTFSYSRALQQPALDMWKGNSENVKSSQQELVKRAAMNSHANRATYSPAMESATSF